MAKATTGTGALPSRARLPREVREAIDAAYWAGVDFGRDVARRELRTELEHEVRAELGHDFRFDPGCALCVAQRRVAELELSLRRARLDAEQLRRKTRGRAIREGRYAARETRR